MIKKFGVNCDGSLAQRRGKGSEINEMTTPFGEDFYSNIMAHNNYKRFPDKCGET